jgi:Protein of unknown function (DUF2867)
MRVTREEFERLDLRAHSLLAGIPLHDVWAVDIPRGDQPRTIAELRRLMSLQNLATINPAVWVLFGLRRALGRVFGWDREPPRATETSLLHRLTPADREQSLVPPGTREGPFQVLFASNHEAILEIQNATVHGFSVVALVERPSCNRFYWGIYVRPVGRLTTWYMRLIDPFRRLIIYPAVLRHVAGPAKSKT